MKTKHVAVASALALLGTAYTLTTGTAAASLPIHEGGGDYPYYKERGNFGVGFSAGAHYETFDYHEVCAALPTRTEALAKCEVAFESMKAIDKTAFNALVGACGKLHDGQVQRYCKKDGKYLEASADAGVTAKLFGAKANVLDVEGYANADSTEAVAGFAFSVVGKKIIGVERPARLEMTMPFTFPLFKAAAGFGLGRNRYVEGPEAVGSFGLTIGAQAGTAGVKFDGTPFAGVDVTATASVGKWLAEAGIEGTVNLVDLRLPSYVSATLANSNTVRWEAGSDLTFNALAGSIDLYGKLAGKRVGSITIYEWSGIPQKRYSVFKDSGFVNF